jgi:cell division protein FtsX
MLIPLLIFIVLITGLCSFFISKAVYKKQVKNDYKNPVLTAVIVFILTLAIFLAGIFLLIINNIRLER